MTHFIPKFVSITEYSHIYDAQQVSSSPNCIALICGVWKWEGMGTPHSTLESYPYPGAHQGWNPSPGAPLGSKDFFHRLLIWQHIKPGHLECLKTKEPYVGPISYRQIGPIFLQSWWVLSYIFRSLSPIFLNFWTPKALDTLKEPLMK